MQRVGVIFDMDGVIVASGPAHATSWRVLARRHGLVMSDAFFRECFGRTSRDIIRDLWRREMSDDEIRRIDEEKEAAYRELIRGMVPLSIGVRETIAGLLADGIALAIATSGPRENVALVLGETGIEPHFAAVVTGFDVQRGKPAPDCFLLAAERIGLDASACVVVEDAPVGIAAARAAGMPVIGYVGTHPAERLRESGADEVVPRLADITPRRVRRLLAR